MPRRRLPQVGDAVDGRFLLKRVCSTAGGMGDVYFVTDITNELEGPLVLKFCKATDEPSIKRFRRETRLLNEFSGNPRVVQLLAFNADHDPPYYVMPYYEAGDLSRWIRTLQADAGYQEETFIQMCDCVSVLHDRSVYHRDIKPQNFLVNDDELVISDLGLCMESDSLTAFTSSAEAWGTEGYTPPEYLSGGFKHADAAFDIFMLGKSFYVLLTQRKPLYLIPDGMHPAMFSVVERCCSFDKADRYQSIRDLKVAIGAAYDVILNRVDGLALCRQIWEALVIEIEASSTCSDSVVNQFIDALARLSEDDQDPICQDLSVGFFAIVAEAQFAGRHKEMLAIYQTMVDRGNYGWKFSEHIADCMREFLQSTAVEPTRKAHALDLAIRAADKMNQFAAMDRCNRMIWDVKGDQDAIAIRNMLPKHANTFVNDTDPNRCDNDIMRRTLRDMREAKKAK